MEKILLQAKKVCVHTTAFALQDISFSLHDGEYLIILGPTGCGKTMFLEMLAGLRRVNCGQLFLGGRDITSLAPEKRGFGFAYQDSLLYPFLTVEENILFGAKAKGIDTDETIKKRLAVLADAMKITHLLGRRPQGLSGGERQRVSLARSMLTSPAVLLLDEPLSALDPQIRSAMEDLLQEVHRTEGMGIIHVTHDFNEALQLGTKVILMNNGEIIQYGKPLEVFEHPASIFAATFLQKKNIVAGYTVRGASNELFFKGVQGNWEIRLLPFIGAPVSAGQKGYLLLPAERFTVGRKNRLQAVAHWPVKIMKIMPYTTHIALLCCGQGSWTVTLSEREWLLLDVSVGDEVDLSIDLTHVHFIWDNE